MVLALALPKSCGVPRGRTAYSTMVMFGTHLSVRVGFFLRQRLCRRLDCVLLSLGEVQLESLATVHFQVEEWLPRCVSGGRIPADDAPLEEVAHLPHPLHALRTRMMRQVSLLIPPSEADFESSVVLASSTISTGGRSHPPLHFDVEIVLHEVIESHHATDVPEILSFKFSQRQTGGQLP